MVTIILITTLIIGFCLLIKSDRYEGHGFGMLFMSLMALAIVLAGITPNCKIETGRTNYEIPIYSLRVNGTVSGSFFLGSGYIGSSNKYYFYTKGNDGRFLLESSWTNNTYLIETDKAPKRTQQKIHYKSPEWLCPFDLAEDEWTSVDLYVPKDTVIKDFKTE